MSYSKFRDKRVNIVDSDKAAHYEPPHLNLLCLQIQPFSFLALQVLGNTEFWHSSRSLFVL